MHASTVEPTGFIPSKDIPRHYTNMYGNRATVNIL